MELPTRHTEHQQLPTEDPDEQQDGRRRRGVSGTLDAIRATRNGKPTEWVSIRYPTADDIRRVWAAIKNPSRREDLKRLPLVRIAWVALYALVGLAFVGACVGGVFGYLKYRSIFHPHHAVHASKADFRSGDVVKPFFAPAGKGGLVDELDVQVSVWFREGNLTEPSEEEVYSEGGVRILHVHAGFDRARPDQMSEREWHRHLYYQQRGTWTEGEDGYARDESPQHPWEELYKASLGRNDLLDKQVTQLGPFTNPLSRLVATFVVAPSNTSVVHQLGSTTEYLSSRPVDKYGANKAWPLSSVPAAVQSDTSLSTFLENGGVGYEIKRWRQWWTDGKEAEEDLLLTRTWLATASDFPTYKRASFLNLHFDWKITYSAVSPAKLKVASGLSEMSNDLVDSYWSETETARQHDNLELYSTYALLGVSFNPNARPITRTVLGGFARLLKWLTVPLIFHYWLTRRTTTGIVLAWWFTQSVSDIVFHIVHSATNQHYFNVPVFVIKLLGFILIGLAQLRLLTGIEVRLTSFVPSALRLRGSTPNERRSAQADEKLDWRVRITALFIVFLVLRLAPSLPPLVRATLNTTEDPLIRLYWRDDQSPLALLWLRNLSSWSSAVWLITRISQIHLNIRNGTFGAFHPLTPYLLVSSLFFSHVAAVFTTFFGRAQSQGPLTAWDVLTFVVEAALAVQARRLPVVRQREEEYLG
ncbi:hypothetical protein JCM6882_003915 [Rhodosporidiobolus microsporus]